MKKITLLAAGLLITGASAFAQTTTSTSSVGSTKWGLKAGVNLAKYSFGKEDDDNPTTENNTNFHVTGYVDLPISNMFSVQPGLSLQGKGGETSTSLVTAKVSTMNIEVPVNLVGKIPVGMGGTNIFLGAGPYASYAIAGEQKIIENSSNSSVTSDLNFGNDNGDDLKAADFGVNFLGGVQLSNGFNIGAGYGLGLTDLRPKGDGGEGQINNRVLSFSVGFAF